MPDDINSAENGPSDFQFEYNIRYSDVRAEPLV